MLEGKNLHKYYKLGETTVKALRGVDVEINEGDFTFVVGPSGSGKTTLLNLLGALDKPTKGKILFRGKEISKFTEYQQSMFRRKRIGFIFQSYQLKSSLTALENILVPLQPEGVTPQDKKRGIELLKEVGLGDRVNHTPTELSGGEIQRVTVARALIKQPDMVLADEPTGELDTETGARLYKSMRKINREEKKPFLIVTHDTEYIKPDDKVLELKDGKVKERRGL